MRSCERYRAIARYVIVVLLGIVGWQETANAADTFTVTLQTAPAEFDMGMTMTATWRITNTATLSSDSITTVRIRTNNGNVVMSSTTAPSGWTVSFGGASGGGFQTVTFTTSFANGIQPGASIDFPLQMKFRTTSADATNQHLRDVRSTFTSPGGATTNVTVNSFSAAANNVWTLRSLVISMTPSATSIGPTCTFTLTMNVTNMSTSIITTVTGNPNPPNRPTVNSLSGGATATTTTSPNIASLAANGGNGSLVWTYTAGSNSGGISFTGGARDSTGTRTSRTITSTPSPTVTIDSAVTCGFNASFNATTPSCLYSGDTATFQMQVTNLITPPTTLSNVQPSSLVSLGTATVTGISAPSPTSIASLAGGGGTGTFTWTGQVGGGTGATVIVSAHATGTAPGPVTRQTNDASSPTKSLAGYGVSADPSAVNAASTNLEITWTVTNAGCNPVSKVSIPIPSTWSWTDSYSIVYTSGAGAFVQTGDSPGGWTAAQVGTNVVFTAPAASYYLPVSSSCTPQACLGYFSVTFTVPSSASGVVSDNLSVTDGTTSVIRSSDPFTLTTNPFDPTGPNQTQFGGWEEIFQ